MASEDLSTPRSAHFLSLRLLDILKDISISEDDLKRTFERESNGVKLIEAVTWVTYRILRDLVGENRSLLPQYLKIRELFPFVGMDEVTQEEQDEWLDLENSYGRSILKLSKSELQRELERSWHNKVISLGRDGNAVGSLIPDPQLEEFLSPVDALTIARRVLQSAQVRYSADKIALSRRYENVNFTSPFLVNLNRRIEEATPAQTS